MRQWILKLTFFIGAVSMLGAAPAAAQERLCDPAFEDCRAPLLEMIRAEQVGIDVAFWFMEDARYANELVKKWQAGVPVRILMDTEANASYPMNATNLATLKNAGIPMREKSGGKGILHWKFMLFAGQGKLEFSGANYSDEAFKYRVPYENYVDEVIYFTDDPAIVDSFRTRMDDAWTDTVMFSNYANITAPPARVYATFPIDPSLNFSPWNNFATRSVAAYRAETRQIDSIMYRITDRRHSDALIAAAQRGVPVRLLTEPKQYRDVTRLWHSWNVDRMYALGQQLSINGRPAIEIKHRRHDGLSHEKLTLLYSQNTTVFGSSNWTSPSADAQHEHNLFTTKQWFFDWSRDHFLRKWDNLGPVVETEPFVPLPPDAAQAKAPLDGASNQPLDVILKWYAGPWAHKYDVYLGTSPSTMTKIVSDVELGPSETATDLVTWPLSGLAESTTYYWQVVSRTMANVERASGVWSFRTIGPPPPAGPNDVVLWAWRSLHKPGWAVATDTSGAGGYRLFNSNVNAPKQDPQASPANYFELGFNAEPGVPYRLWIRGKAEKNSYNNDSVWVQFSDSVLADGVTPTWRIGSTSAASVTIEDCSGCGVSGWGWNDTLGGGTAGALGPLVYFETAGPHVVRVQVREDGLSIDQIVLSRDAFMTSAPGAPKSDGTVYAEQNAVPLDPPVTPLSTLPQGWNNRDIGAVAELGSANFSNSTFSVTGSGADIWNSADEFHFTYTTLTGDGSVVAKVASLEAIDSWTKAGVMLRESLSAGSRNAAMLVSAGKGLTFQRRLSSGSSTTNVLGGTGKAPYWVKLVRVGNTVTALKSSNGTTWVTVATDTVTMAPTIYVGLAVTSRKDGSTATGTFTNVVVSSDTTAPAPPPPPPPPVLPEGWSTSDIGAVGAAGTANWDSASGVWTVKGSGLDIWGTADEFRYVYRPFTGDGEIVARVASVQGTDVWSKAGVMMRNSLAAGSVHASMFVSYGKGTAFQRRGTLNGISTSTAGEFTGPPRWVRLVRIGTSFTADLSADGITWTRVGTETLPMDATIFVGLAVTSHKDGTVATDTFDNVAVTAY